jgi:hypothetical protein
MKLPINLSSQPFRRDRAMTVASIAVIVALAVTLSALIVFIQQDRLELAGLRQSIARLNRQVSAASTEQARLEGIMRQPQNSSVLEWSTLINTLIYHKSISWSRLLSDLERTLPYDVKVVAVHPSIDALNHVKLDMTLGSDKMGSIVSALKAFEASPAFGTVIPGNSNPPTQAEPLYRYRLTVNYAQKL